MEYLSSCEWLFLTCTSQGSSRIRWRGMRLCSCIDPPSMAIRTPLDICNTSMYR